MKKFTIEQIRKMAITKGELIKKMGVSVYDTALPQSWLNSFVNETGLDYHIVLGTTIWSYDGDGCFGKPVSACVDVQKKIDEMYKF